ncbi:MAG: UMP kinase [Spirochaetia bacterium]
MKDVQVISLGGSIVAPDAVNTDFIRRFRDTARRFLDGGEDRKLILVVGGGAPARRYQQAYRDLTDTPDAEEQDWIGINATRLNGRLLKAIFADECSDDLVTDPHADIPFSGRVLTAAGWKPGFSTDYDAVLLAERFGGRRVINLSNIKKVYTADPKTNPDAEPLDSMSWADFRRLVGDEWSPGSNLPFDPVAAKKSQEMGLTVVVAEGANLENIEAILLDKKFEGTVIGPE